VALASITPDGRPSIAVNRIRSVGRVSARDESPDVRQASFASRSISLGARMEVAIGSLIAGGPARHGGGSIRQGVAQRVLVGKSYQDVWVDTSCKQTARRNVGDAAMTAAE
jgi:hypothetical protein